MLSMWIVRSRDEEWKGVWRYWMQQLCQARTYEGSLWDELTSKTVPVSYLLLTLLLYFLSIFYLAPCTLPDFASISSQASLSFLSCCHRTTTSKYWNKKRNFTSKNTSAMNGKMYLVIIESFSKSIEVFSVIKITADKFKSIIMNFYLNIGSSNSNSQRQWSTICK